MRGSRIVALFIGGAFLLPVGPARAAPAARAVRDAAAYVVSQQQSSGAFFAPDATADGVAEAVAALATAGVRGDVIGRALAYVRAHGPSRAAERPAYAGRIVIGIVAGGEDPRRFGGTDYVAIIERALDPVTGRADAGIYADALAKLGLLAGRVGLPGSALTYLRANQCTDGGFAHDEGCLQRSDVDTTAIVLCVLAGAGVARDDDAIVRAREFLRAARNDDGGFGARAGDDTNANSTGLALSALAALGDEPTTAPWRAGSADPVRALLSLQTESGAFRYSAASADPNGYATIQVIPGLAGSPYPIRVPRARAAERRTPEDAPSGARPGPSLVASPASAVASPSRSREAARADRSRSVAAQRTSPDSSSGLLGVLAALAVGGAGVSVLVRSRRA